MENQIRISAVICTFNRVDHLINAIKSLISQDLNKQNFEILIIDNNSTDKTRSIIKKQILQFSGNMRYILEKNQGLSFARNRGIKEAKGDIISFLDDDAIASSHWLKSILNSFTKNLHRPSVVGGPVSLNWEIQKEDWCVGEIKRLLFSSVDYGDVPHFLEDKKGPVGANIAFDREVLLQEGIFFNTELGRIGNNLLSGEETEVMDSLRRGGYRVFYDPAARVSHFAPKERMNLAYALKRFYWQGRSIAIHRYNRKKDNVIFLCKNIFIGCIHLIFQLIRLFLLEKSVFRLCRKKYWEGYSIQYIILMKQYCKKFQQ